MSEAYSAYRALGAHIEEAGTRFRAYTTTARRCAVRLFEADGRACGTLPMEPRGDGLFELVTNRAPAGTLYKFVLDERELPDPYARFLPQGVHGPAVVCASRHVFQHAGVKRPLHEQILYELHIGTFSEEGSYLAAQARLPELVELGVTTLELMPVAAFAGARGWGYDGVALFAPHAPYGTPDELRALVDAAHGHGLSVLLDVVYNHFGPAGNYLTAYSPNYFSHEERNAWGDAPNFAHPAMRAYVLANARYWLEQFRFDGLRLDAVHAILDSSPKHVLRELAEEVRAFFPDKTLIAEDDRNDPALVAEVGLDAVWADDFHHALQVTLTGERDGYYAAYRPGAEAIARAIEGGWIYTGQLNPVSGKPRGEPAPSLPSWAFVYCLQNHDQVGNRALGNRLSDDVSVDAYCAASMLLLFLPMTPLLFMGQEWAATTPFLYFTDHDPELGAKVSAGRREEFKGFAAFSDPEARARIPDPQAYETFARSRLDRAERTSAHHARVLALYRRAIALRRDDPVLRDAAREQLRASARGQVLLVKRWSGESARILAVNFAAEASELGAHGIPERAAVLLASGPLAPHGQLAAASAMLFALPHERSTP